MSLWNMAKNIGTSIANTAAEKANEIRQISEKYESKSDSDLIGIVNSDGFLGSSSTEKGVAFRILKSRGYNADDIKSS